MAKITNTIADANDAFEFYRAGYASMLWGFWLREHEAAKVSNWQKCFRSRVLEELEFLDDDDPINDMQALHALAITFLHANDSINAAATLAILFKPVEDEQATCAKIKSRDFELDNKKGDRGHERLCDSAFVW